MFPVPQWHSAAGCKECDTTYWCLVDSQSAHQRHAAFTQNVPVPITNKTRFTQASPNRMEQQHHKRNSNVNEFHSNSSVNMVWICMNHTMVWRTLTCDLKKFRSNNANRYIRRSWRSSARRNGLRTFSGRSPPGTVLRSLVRSRFSSFTWEVLQNCLVSTPSTFIFGDLAKLFLFQH